MDLGGEAKVFNSNQFVYKKDLLHKLERYGIDGPLFEFVMDRLQRVVLHGSYFREQF